MEYSGRKLHVPACRACRTWKAGCASRRTQPIQVAPLPGGLRAEQARIPAAFLPMQAALPDLSCVREILRPAMHPTRHALIVLLPLLLPALLACDQIAVLDGSKARDADAIAVGSACRQSGRALEDCFVMYPESSKSQVFAGWKEMNDYMTQNKIENVAPALVKAENKTEARVAKVDRQAPKTAGLPPTSTAAADPMAGIAKPPPSAQVGIPGVDKAEAKAGEAAGAKPAADEKAKHH